MRIRTAVLGAALAGVTLLGLDVPATAAPSNPVPLPPNAQTSSSSTTVRGEQADKLAKAVRERAAKHASKKLQASAAVTLTSEPSVLTVFPNEATLGTLIVANAGGDLVWRAWTTDQGWSPWYNEGGNISGRPLVAVNVADYGLDIYAVSEGRLKRNFTNGWEDFGIETTSEPVAVTNWNTGNFQLYVVSKSGELMERYLAPGGQWSGWSGFGIQVTKGTVAPLWNDSTADVHLFVNSGNQIAERTWSHEHKRWSNWTRFPGVIVTEPVALFNLNNENIQVYAAGADNWVNELYLDHASNSWRGWHSLGLYSADKPAAFFNDLNGNVQVYGTQPDRQIKEKFWDARTGKWEMGYLGGSVVGALTVSRNWILPHVQLIGLGKDGQLTENYWAPGKGWSGWHTITG